MNQYHPTFDLKINVGHCDLYFIVQWFCLISSRLFDVWTSLFGIMNQFDPTFDLKINVGLCDLYFMGQWFWIISWRLFDVWTSSLGIIGQYDRMFDLKINVCRCDLYLYPRYLCWGVYSFHLSVCPFILYAHLFICDSVPFVELVQSFMLTFCSCWGILYNRYHLPLDFFANIINFCYFLEHQNADFFHFPTPNMV